MVVGMEVGMRIGVEVGMVVGIGVCVGAGVGVVFVLIVGIDKLEQQKNKELEMTELETITNNLERLQKLRTRLGKIGQKHDEEKEKLLAPLKKKLELINEKHDEEATEVLNKIEEIEDKIKSDVIERGESVSTDTLIAVYTKPRMTWSNDKLEGFALIHPEILNARTTAPKGTAQIRAKK